MGKVPPIWCDRCGEKRRDTHPIFLSNGRLEQVCAPCQASEALDLLALRAKYLRMLRYKKLGPVPTHPDMLGWPPK